MLRRALVAAALAVGPALLLGACGGGGGSLVSGEEAANPADPADPADRGIPGGYAVVDTGQDGCYDDLAEIACPAPFQAFHGQDAQHAGNQPSYRDHGDGSVTDLVTGLTWQRGFASTKLTWAEALAYAETVNARGFAGFADWRVPSIEELYSLIDFRGTDPPPEGTSTAGVVPFIDTDYFDFAYGDTAAGERIIDSQWATTTLYVANSRMMFGVNFADGRIKGYGLTSPDPRRGEKTFYVRLCRGNPAYGRSRYLVGGDGTVTDEATALMWMQADSGYGMDWEGALAYAERRNAEAYLGYADWRVPDVKELQSIVDYTRSPDTTRSAAIDPVFETTAIVNLAGETDYPFYWSSTTHRSSRGNGANACYVAFGRGLGDLGGGIVDIHGAGCQRSDPKTGNASEYPQSGHGPQGDVQRVFNYVRLVRDVDERGQP